MEISGATGKSIEGRDELSDTALALREQLQKLSSMCEAAESSRETDQTLCDDLATRKAQLECDTAELRHTSAGIASAEVSSASVFKIK